MSSTEIGSASSLFENVLIPSKRVKLLNCCGYYSGIWRATKQTNLRGNWNRKSIQFKGSKTSRQGREGSKPSGEDQVTPITKGNNTQLSSCTSNRGVNESLLSVGKDLPCQLIYRRFNGMPLLLLLHSLCPRYSEECKWQRTTTHNINPDQWQSNRSTWTNNRCA